MVEGISLMGASDNTTCASEMEQHVAFQAHFPKSVTSRILALGDLWSRYQQVFLEI